MLSLSCANHIHKSDLYCRTQSPTHTHTHLHECQAEVVSCAAPVHWVLCDVERKACYLLIHQNSKVVTWKIHKKTKPVFHNFSLTVSLFFSVIQETGVYPSSKKQKTFPKCPNFSSTSSYQPVPSRHVFSQQSPLDLHSVTMVSAMPSTDVLFSQSYQTDFGPAYQVYDDF